MAKFIYYLREPKANQETTLQLVVWHLNKQLKISTGKTIHPKYWNQKKQTARAALDFPQAKVFNSTLSTMVQKAEKCLFELERELERSPSPKELKEAIDAVLRVKDETKPTNEKPSFLQLFSRFIKESETGERLSDTGKRLSPLSIKKYKTTETRLHEFSKKYNLDFDTIDQNFYKKFLGFLNQEGFKPNTIGKYIQVIKTFMKYAMENGYTTNTEFQKRTFKAFSETGFSIYLTEDEIMDLWELDLSKHKRLAPVRDLFIIGCYTGLRYSDVSRLSMEHLEGDFFKIKTLKTKQTVIIPIHPIVKAIMERHEGVPKAISNQKTNQYLKEITAMVPSLQKTIQIDQVEGGQTVHKIIPKFQLVTTHTARRSFATNLYKSGQMTSWDIMQITGHKTEQAFLKYIKVTPEESANRLRQLWNDKYQMVKL